MDWLGIGAKSGDSGKYFCLVNESEMPALIYNVAVQGI